MPRITITLPKATHEKLQKHAEDNDVSLSQTIAKMAEIGLMVVERKEQNKDPESQFSDIEKHCFKLIIQTNALLKNMAQKQLDYGSEAFKKLSDVSHERY